MPHVCHSICESVSVGDTIRLIATPEQTGIITQKDKMKFCNLVILWNQGPVHDAGTKSLLICHLGEASVIEPLP
jgi:hypothetical protein